MSDFYVYSRTGIWYDELIDHDSLQPDIQTLYIFEQSILYIYTKVVRKVNNVLPYKDIYW